jgi:NADPH:quinone reductase-like Zn-dependent oxidoreductase
MKAVVCHRYGPPEALRLEDMEIPTPGEDEVLVKVRAVSLNQPDAFMVLGEPKLSRLFMGLFKPKWAVPGSDIAGTVESVGRGVTILKPGDEVYGDTSDTRFGGFAEYAIASAKELALKPDSLSFAEAAAAPMSVTVALQGLCDRVPIRPGQRVLIIGASGGNGTYAVQVAKSLGAEVTGTCGPSSREMVQSLGADEVIDYTQDDFATRGEYWDFIFAVKGHRPLSVYKRALRPGGTYLMVGGTMKQVFASIFFGPLFSRGGKKMMNLQLTPGQNDLLRANELFEAGKLVSAIDRTYPLSDAGLAIAHYQTGHAHGKIVLTVGADTEPSAAARR